MAIPSGRLGAHLRDIAYGSVGRSREVMREHGQRAAMLARQYAPTRSGRLSLSIRASPLRERAAAGFSLVSRHPAAAIQEFGGDILPRSVRMLAVPLQGQTVWPRQVGRHIVIRARNGRLYLFDRRPRDGGSPRYELRDRVTVRPQPYMRPALDRVQADILRDLPGSVLRSR